MSAEVRSMILCVIDLQPGTRDDCPDALHDYPLPDGYNDAHEAAGRRIRKGWSQKRCPACHLYGWRPGRPTEDACDTPERMTLIARKEAENV